MDDAPPALVDALVLATVQRLATEPGQRVPLSALRREFGALSDAAVTVALLDAEKRGVIVLESSGDKPPEGATFWMQRGARGVLAWARTTSDG